MNIAYTLNNKFVPQVAASIASICENNKDAKTINFYLLHTDITNSNQKKLEKFIYKYRHKANFIKLDNMPKYFDFEFDTNGWNPIVLARLLLDRLLPNCTEKVLYLDGDTIIRGNLQKLWGNDLSKYTIAASIEPTVDKKRKSQLGLSNLPYYNAGVLLINLKKWRKDNTGKKIIEYYKKNSGRLFANDQDAINGSQKGEILTLSPKYNYYNIFDQYPHRFLSKLCDYPYISYAAYEEARKNPIIIHYLGEERPWRIGNKHKYKNDYLKYLDMTPWKSQGLEDGWELYFICWNIFNFLTKPFPGLRYNIINALIPTFMNCRSKKLTKNKEK